MDKDRNKDGRFNSRARFEDSPVEGETNLLEVLPSVSFDATISVGTTESCQWVGGETILLVEDEDLVRKAVQEALQSAGYRVITAENAAQALAAYHERAVSVDLLLSDAVMPGISGHELAQSLFALCPYPNHAHERLYRTVVATRAILFSKRVSGQAFFHLDIVKESSRGAGS
ncbi:MAG: response regulator [Candidatus Sulfotelmatobacter sp.]